MTSYSIAIRTLGTAGEKYLDELRSISQQTIQPEKVVVYIAEGYERPKEQIANEQYVWVPKGMMAQRALPYNEIASDCILLLDDDIMLAPDIAERMLTALETNHADCVGVDIFYTQDLPFVGKIYAAVTNLVFPRPDDGWAFKIHRNGSFSYNNQPKSAYYPSESCAGACSIWRKDALLRTHLEHELWTEREGFWYGEDVLLFYKLHLNGGRLGILYNSGVTHLDGGAASHSQRNDLKKYYIRAKASALIWHRTIYSVHQHRDGIALLAFSLKQVWLFLVNCIAGIVLFKPQIPFLFIKGLRDAYRFTQTEHYRTLTPFKQNTPVR